MNNPTFSSSTWSSKFLTSLSKFKQERWTSGRRIGKWNNRRVLRPLQYFFFFRGGQTPSPPRGVDRKTLFLWGGWGSYRATSGEGTTTSRSRVTRVGSSTPRSSLLSRIADVELTASGARREARRTAEEAGTALWPLKFPDELTQLDTQSSCNLDQSECSILVKLNAVL